MTSRWGRVQLARIVSLGVLVHREHILNDKLEERTIYLRDGVG